MLSRKTLVGALVALVALGGGVAGYKYWRHVQATAPQPTPATAVVVNGPPTAGPTAATSLTPTSAPTPLPPSVFVQVPYTAQSPYNQWGANDPHEEYCEAAALLMVSDFFKGVTGDANHVIPKDVADGSMAQIVGVERRMFPGVLDLPLTSIGAVGTQMFGLQATVMPVNLDQIRSNLARGRPVIIPVMTHGANGAKIARYYGAVNVYHVIVLTGYDLGKGVLYANDAGFVQGQNWQYTWDTLSTAIDAQAQRFSQGRVMLVFSGR
jgi:hypothetical protein